MNRRFRVRGGVQSCLELLALRSYFFAHGLEGRNLIYDPSFLRCQLLLFLCTHLCFQLLDLATKNLLLIKVVSDIVCFIHAG